MDEPTYTKESADALLPEITDRIEQMRIALTEAARQSENVAPHVGGNGGAKAPDEWMRATRRLETHSKWFAERGIVLRDVQEGIIDFPGVIDGEEVFLCWRVGEAEVGFWHPTDTGFAGRQPL